MIPAWNAPLVRDVYPEFARFLDTGYRILRYNSNVKVWCETRIARAHDSHAPLTANSEPSVHPKTGTVHRCDLVKLWATVKSRPIANKSGWVVGLDVKIMANGKFAWGYRGSETDLPLLKPAFAALEPSQELMQDEMHRRWLSNHS